MNQMRKKTSKKAAAEADRTPRSGDITAVFLSSQKEDLQSIAGMLDAIARELQENKLDKVTIDGINKFSRAKTMLKEYIAACNYFIEMELAQRE